MVLYKSLLNVVVTCQTSIISNKNEGNFVEKQSPYSVIKLKRKEKEMFVPHLKCLT